MLVKNLAQDVTTYFVLRDNINHLPSTTVVVTDIDLYYIKELSAISAKADALALAAADSPHADNRAFHVGQGVYRIDWPDVAFTAGIGKKVELIVVCAGIDTTFLEVELSAPVDTVSISGTSQTARDLGASVLISPGVGLGQLAVTNGVLDANLVQILTTALVETIAGRLAGAFRKWFDMPAPTGTINSIPDVVAGLAGGLSLVGSQMTLADDAIQAAKYDEATAFPLKANDVGATLVARTGADGDTLKTLSDQLDISNVDIYTAKCWVFDDNALAADRYNVVWYKNGVPVTAGITFPFVQVIRSSDGTDLVASTAMTQSGATGLYFYNELINRILDGAAYVIRVSATIDGGVRVHYQPAGRDSVI